MSARASLPNLVEDSVLSLAPRTLSLAFRQIDSPRGPARSSPSIVNLQLHHAPRRTLHSRAPPHRSVCVRTPMPIALHPQTRAVPHPAALASTEFQPALPKMSMLLPGPADLRAYRLSSIDSRPSYLHLGSARTTLTRMCM
ncbi:uncharacterized protein B0H18DRAFT_444670 [Fomitopsis serialis]|uniref:uncharacterized protein n=1 Tax=Fomitopsis serialis TaxID=139415 RepID=UPI002007621D|nr:uncharacterized protein B0H18DRAFT_444670 [Neoantrodia serialis]KAH9924041.1 hypothetical protein B0H18DRAFT_444670 [Neoantrodia serialis]